MFHSEDEWLTRVKMLDASDIIIFMRSVPSTEGSSQYIEPSPESVAPNFLQRVFTDKEFIKRLKRMTRIKDVESAFSVRRQNNQPIFSRVVEGEENHDLIQGSRVTLAAFEEVLYPSTPNPASTPNLNFTWNPKYYRDLVFFIHSHPQSLDESVNDVLRPSSVDLSTSENLWTFSPSLVGGILVHDTKNREIVLLLFQKDPDSKEPNYYQQYDESQSLETLQKLMQKSGVLNTVLKLPTGSSELDPKELAKLSRFKV